jgi:hypothetical protein
VADYLYVGTYVHGPIVAPKWCHVKGLQRQNCSHSWLHMPLHGAGAMPEPFQRAAPDRTAS